MPGGAPGFTNQYDRDSYNLGVYNPSAYMPHQATSVPPGVPPPPGFDTAESNNREMLNSLNSHVDHFREFSDAFQRFTTRDFTGPPGPPGTPGMPGMPGRDGRDGGTPVVNIHPQVNPPEVHTHAGGTSDGVHVYPEIQVPAVHFHPQVGRPTVSVHHLPSVPVDEHVQVPGGHVNVHTMGEAPTFSHQHLPAVPLDGYVQAPGGHVNVHTVGSQPTVAVHPGAAPEPVAVPVHVPGGHVDVHPSTTQPTLARGASDVHPVVHEAPEHPPPPQFAPGDALGGQFQFGGHPLSDQVAQAHEVQRQVEEPGMEATIIGVKRPRPSSLPSAAPEVPAVHGPSTEEGEGPVDPAGELHVDHHVRESDLARNYPVLPTLPGDAGPSQTRPRPESTVAAASAAAAEAERVAAARAAAKVKKTAQAIKNMQSELGPAHHHTPGGVKKPPRGGPPV